MKTKEEESLPKAPEFLDIQMINNIPCMYLRYNAETLKQEWLCLEIPNEPQMSWKNGKAWCQSKDGDYGEISTLKFISEQREKMNQVIKVNGYPLIEYNGYWSINGNSYYSWMVTMYNGTKYAYSSKRNYGYVRCIVSL